MIRKPEWVPTINAIREALREEWEEGTECPCCSQRVKLYPRTVNKGTAEVLVAIARETIRRRSSPDHRPWIAVERDLIRGNADLQGARDWTTLKYWKLIEPLDDGNGRRIPGEWRITPEGLWVVEHPDRKLLADTLLVFNDKVRETSEKKRSLEEALQRPFKREEVVRAA